MKRVILITALLFACFAVRAQAPADSLSAKTAPVDSTLVGVDIVMVLGDNVTLTQSAQVRNALLEYIRANEEKPVMGYRVRVFHDNSTQARTQSESLETYLKGKYPEIGVYRTFESPNYKVTVGDFRTRDDALRIYMALKKQYPTAYIIKEEINYPL